MALIFYMYSIIPLIVEGTFCLNKKHSALLNHCWAIKVLYLLHRVTLVVAVAEIGMGVQDIVFT